MKLVVRHVVAAHRTVDAVVTTDDGHSHRIGHLPSTGWYCATCGKRCRHIGAIRDLVPPMTEPTQPKGTP